MVQTQASAAGTLSSIIFILPALVMMGYWQGFPFWQTLASGRRRHAGRDVLDSAAPRHGGAERAALSRGVAAAEILRVGSAERAQEAQADAAPGKAAKPAATGMADIAAGGVVAAAVSFAASGLRVLGESVSGWFALGGRCSACPWAFRWRCWAPAT